MPDQRPLRVLAIDGGGIRGVIPSIVLSELEKIAKRPVHELFDLIAGTSTGGLIALALTQRSQRTGEAWTAENLVKLYKDEGANIFKPRTRLARAGSLGSVMREKYAADGIEGVLERHFGEAMLSESLTAVMVPAYDIEQRARYWFKSRKAKADAEDDVRVRDAARATSAAPTYFAPAWVKRQRRHRALVDGGVFANNPAMAAYAEARDAYRAEEVLIVSIGTGELTRPLTYSKARRWGLAKWAQPMLDVVFDGVSAETDHNLRKLLGSDRYYRLQTVLYQASDDMDDASEDNLHLLMVQAENLAFQNKVLLRDLAERLAPPEPVSAGQQ